MRLTRRASVLSLAALLALPALAQASTPTSSTAPALQQGSTSFQPWLERHLTEVSADTPLRVAVRGTSVEAAAAAVAAAGLVEQQRWSLVDVVVGVGTAAQVEALRDQEGVLRVEGDQPLSFSLQTAHEATRSNEARATYTAPDGSVVDGTGVTIAVIDSGIDATHPMFQRGGKTTVVRNLKNVCGTTTFTTPSLNETCFRAVPGNDTDTTSAGGHGTHVAGIAAGVPVTTVSPAGKQLRGSASGATLVGLSVGAGLGLLDAQAAQNWVLEHQQNPCRPAAAQTASEVDADCPPIRVTNHSYGPAGDPEDGNSFDERAIAVQLQRALVKKGVVAVWAAGNSGGDGSVALTNPSGMDPTPGIVMVASYDDDQKGSRDHKLSGFSSRGKAGEPSTYPDLAAPGQRITSACRVYLTVCSTGFDPVDGGNYNTISGTSMAAPYVAGVVAQLFEADPSLTPAEVEDVLEDTAHKFTAGGAYEGDPLNTDDTTSFDKGHGLVDVLEALRLVSGGSTDTSGTTCTPRGKSGVCKVKGGGKPDKR